MIQIVILIILFLIICGIIGAMIGIHLLLSDKSKSVTNKYSDWIKENWEENNILAPPLEAQKAIHFLTDYLLGEDWYDSSGATHPEQVNTKIVHEILYKYSPEYRKEINK